jgi:hypothetical protein
VIAELKLLKAEKLTQDASLIECQGQLRIARQQSEHQVKEIETLRAAKIVLQ